MGRNRLATTPYILLGAMQKAIQFLLMNGPQRLALAATHSTASIALFLPPGKDLAMFCAFACRP